MEDEVESITEAVATELEEFTTTGAVGSDSAVITESVDVVG